MRRELKRSNWISRLALTTVLLMLLTGCAVSTSSCPPFPVADKKAGDELAAACIAKDTKENYCPNLFAWLGKVHKLEKQLEVK